MSHILVDVQSWPNDDHVDDGHYREHNIVEEVDLTHKANAQLDGTAPVDEEEADDVTHHE